MTSPVISESMSRSAAVMRWFPAASMVGELRGHGRTQCLRERASWSRARCGGAYLRQWAGFGLSSLRPSRPAEAGPCPSRQPRFTFPFTL